MAKIKLEMNKETAKTKRREQIAADMAALKNANAAQQKEILARVLALLHELL